jgi:hypothetical protein
MDYLTAWREGHEAGMQLSLKIINELTGQDFKKSAEVVLYIKQLEGDSNFEFKQPKQVTEKIDVISTKEEKLIDRLSTKIAMKNWMWS